MPALAAIFVLLVNYRRLEDINERRRVRVMVAGFVLAWVVVIPFLFTNNLDPNHLLARVYANPVLGSVLLTLTLAFPMALTYAVLRHRARVVGAHVLALSFVLLVMSLTLLIYLTVLSADSFWLTARVPAGRPAARTRLVSIGHYGLYALAIGALLVTNSWDYPIYLALMIGSALAAFMYPHTLTGIFAAKDERISSTAARSRLSSS